MSLEQNNVEFLINDLLNVSVSIDSVPLFNIVKQCVAESNVYNIDELMYILSIQSDTTIFKYLVSYFIQSGNYYSSPKFSSTYVSKNNINLVLDYINTLSKNEVLSLYWSLFRHMTLEQLDFYENINNIYKNLLTKVKEDIKINFQDTNGRKRVLLFANQYVGGLHAPTKIVNLWAENFVKNGYEVIIIVSTPRPFKFPFSKKIPMMFRRKYPFGQFLNLGNNIRFLDVGHFPEQNYVDFLHDIEIAKNDILISVGHSNLHFDVLPTSKKYNIPLATPDGNPILTNAKYFLYRDNIELKNIDNEVVFIEKISSDYTDIKVDFKLKTLSFDKKIKLVVVSNRLQDELDDIFWKSISKIKFDFKLYLIGKYSQKNVPVNLKDKVELLGFQQNLVDSLSEMDFFVNPDRNGGGQSAIYAVKFGMPIITLPKGDVYNNIFKKYSINHLDEIEMFVTKYITDIEFKNKIDNFNIEINEIYTKENGITEFIEKLSIR